MTTRKSPRTSRKSKPLKRNKEALPVREGFFVPLLTGIMSSAMMGSEADSSLFSQCTYTVQMKQEDGQWKVASQDMDQLFAPDSYQPIQGGFGSYQEALDFVNGLDVQALDPFAL